MATKKVTTTTQKSCPTRGRASERKAISVRASATELLSLMTEQCDTGAGLSTFYSGSRAQFVVAGIPNNLLPSGAKTTSFLLNPGGSWFGGEVEAHLTRLEDGYELEIQWGHRGPYLCAHPALQTIARVMVGRLWELTRLDCMSRTSEVPLEKLAGLSESHAVCPDRRIEFSPAFKRTLNNTVYTTLWHTILSGEVLPMTATQSPADAAKSDSDFQRLLKAVTNN